jgi:hypothetical protein
MMKPKYLRLSQVPAFLEKWYGTTRSREQIYSWCDPERGLHGRHLHTTEQARPGCRTPIRVVSVTALDEWVRVNRLARFYLTGTEGSECHV